MAKRRAARRDSLETVIPSATGRSGASITKPGGACSAAAAVTAMEICAVSGVSCRKVGGKTAFAEITYRISQRAARHPSLAPSIPTSGPYHS